MSTQQFVAQQEKTDQAETSNVNPIATGIRMRTLIELQVISHLLSKSTDEAEDLAQLRRSIALSIGSDQ